MDNPPGSVPAQRRTTLVAFLVLLIAVMVLTVLMVLPYVLAVTMGGLLALLARPALQWLQGHHVPPRVAAALVVLALTSTPLHQDLLSDRPLAHLAYQGPSRPLSSPSARTWPRTWSATARACTM